MKDQDILAQCQKDFETHFGVSETITTNYETFGGESVIAVESHAKKAIYSLDGDLIKVTNLEGEK